MFEIETDRADRIIFLRLSGGLTIDEAQACATAKQAAVDRLGAPYDAHSTLLDIRDLRVQPQDVFAVFTNFVTTAKYKPRKIAIVGGEGTARMQFRRVAEREPLRDNMRFFTDIGEARAWLGASAIAKRSSERPSLPPARLMR